MFFYNKSKILTIIFKVKYEEITLFDEFFVLLGPIISRFFAFSNEEKITKTTKVVRSSLISMLPPERDVISKSGEAGKSYIFRLRLFLRKYLLK